jgi:hypothetical protein
MSSLRHHLLLAALALLDTIPILQKDKPALMRPLTPHPASGQILLPDRFQVLQMSSQAQTLLHSTISMAIDRWRNEQILQQTVAN